MSDADAFLPENLPNGSILRNLISQYDLVYVDWKNGTDDLYRNAKLLKKVIALVNADKVAVNGVIQPNVIIGQSMGGVITRIALKEMENAGINHQTRLFISQDAPQQGANVPIAYQYMGRHFRNIYISTGTVALGVELFQLIRGGVSPLKALSLSNEPASQQMLINYISDFGTLRNVHHDDFYASLRALGYPSQCRMVAMSNGSECANSQGFEPGASLLSIDGKVQTRFLGDVAVSALSYFVSPLFPLNRIFKIGFLPGRNEIRANINLHAIGNGGGNQVYYCDITYTKKLFYLVNINLTLAHKEKNADSGMISIDGYPGGSLFPTESLQSASLTNWFIKYNLNVSVNKAFNFVPTISSLDIGGGSTALGTPDFLRVYSASSPPIAPKQTPFANFIVARQNNASINEGHISFNARNADWVGNEIGTVAAGPNPQIVDCSYLCSGSLQIQGPVQFCTSQTYTIPNLPSNSAVTWSATGNIEIYVDVDEPTYVGVSKTASSGSGTLSATISSSCGNVIITKTINIRTPNPTVYGLNQTFEAHQEHHVSVSNPQTDWIYNWELFGTNVHFTNGPGSNHSSGLSIGCDDSGTFILRLTVTDACGNIGIVEETLYIEGSYNKFISYPNPANNEITVSFGENKNGEKSKNPSDLTDSKKPVRIISVTLYDAKGNAITKSSLTQDRNAVLDTKNIPSGTYFLHIKDGKETMKKQIIINH